VLVRITSLYSCSLKLIGDSHTSAVHQKKYNVNWTNCSLYFSFNHLTALNGYHCFCQLAEVITWRWTRWILGRLTLPALYHRTSTPPASVWNCSTGSERNHQIMPRRNSGLLLCRRSSSSTFSFRFLIWRLIFRGSICAYRTVHIGSLLKANAALKESFVQYHWMTSPWWTAVGLVRWTST